MGDDGRSMHYFRGALNSRKDKKGHYRWGGTSRQEEPGRTRFKRQASYDKSMGHW